MWSNFWGEQNLKNGQQTVDARGPLFWNLAPSATEVTVEARITDENGVVASNGAVRFQRGTGEWRIDLAAGGQQLKRGRARAHGVVTVVQPSPEPGVPWEQDVWLS